MDSKHFSFYFGLIFILICINSASVQAFRVNITRFQSCDIPGEKVEHLVYIRDILYEFDAAGYCDTVHGKYRIPTVNVADKLLDITMFQCPTGHSGICNDKPQTFHEHVHCDRFHNDKTGPWSMISDGMSGSHCGELEGEFTLDNATLKKEYIANYIIQDPNFARHRLNIIFRKKAVDSNGYILRGCIDIDFDVKY